MRVAVNYAKYVVDITLGYYLGDPVKYDCNDTHDMEGGPEIDLRELLNCYDNQQISEVDSRVGKGMGVFGECLELCYASSDADGSTRTVATGSGAKYRATRLIRTEGNYITGQAKLQSMKDAGYEKYEFICLLETRTCSVCGGLDGKQFPVTEAQPGVNMNPMHPNCRCFVSPVVSKRLMEAGTRGAQVDASGRKETVPASMTYQEWYEKYVKGNGGNDGQLKRLKEPQAFSDSQIAITEHPALTPQDIRETPQEPEIEVEKVENPGIMASEGDEPLHTIGKLDMDKYRCIADDITTDEVIITDERIQHIEERHPGDFERIAPYLSQAIADPDYILKDKHSTKSGLILKSVQNGDLRFQVVVRVHTSTDNPAFKNSILSAWTISESRWEGYINNRKILYKRE